MTTKQIDYTILFCDAIRTEPSSERRLHSEKSASRRFFLAFRYGLTDSPSRERLLKKIFDMAADQQQFLHLLSTLLSTDNTIRSNAEVSFNILHNEKRGFAMWHAVACDEGSRQRVSYPSCVCTCGALQVFLVTHLFYVFIPFQHRLRLMAFQLKQEPLICLPLWEMWLLEKMWGRWLQFFSDE